MKNFYQKARPLLDLFFWRWYLRWVYKRALKDGRKMGIKFPIHSCFLCGVAGQVTADEYLRKALSIGKETEVLIIDLGEAQVESVKQLVGERYKDYRIFVRQANALSLDFIKDRSVDWIETDGFFIFFNHEELKTLLKNWKRILKDSGFITTRDFSNEGFLGGLIDDIRVFLVGKYFGIKINRHSAREFEEIFRVVGFRFERGGMPVPGMVRYCLRKS